MLKAPVVFDCDPGHDDAIALLLALASDSLEVKAVTTVCGNAGVDHTTQNALKILEMAGRQDIPVAMGAAKPMFDPLRTGANVHGESGMEGPVLPALSTLPSPLRAVELMAQVVEQSTQPVVLIVTGPCTNVATFLLSYPHLHSKIECISIMGGGFKEGNRTQVAEFNIWQDPEAAQVIMASGLPVALYGLDVTHKALVLPEEFALFRQQGDSISEFVAQLLDYYSVFYTSPTGGGLAGCPMHDACAVAGVMEPRLFTYEQCGIEIDLDGRLTRGGCVIDLRPEPRREFPYNGKVALDVDREGFLSLLLAACRTLAQQKEGKV